MEACRIGRGSAINSNKKFRVKSQFSRTVKRSSVSKSDFDMTFEWQCPADRLKCGTKVETSRLEIEISRTDESSAGMQQILDRDKNQGLSMRSWRIFCIL